MKDFLVGMTIAFGSGEVDHDCDGNIYTYDWLWFHFSSYNGGYFTGFGNTKWYNGERLNRAGQWVVNSHYQWRKFLKQARAFFLFSFGMINSKDFKLRNLKTYLVTAVKIAKLTTYGGK